jgi:hypothetical protein
MKRLQPLMRALALEILRRKLVTWWTNIRFEKVSLEICAYQSFWLYRRFWWTQVASDRLLNIDKGVTVEQVAKVTRISPKLVLWACI